MDGGKIINLLIIKALIILTGQKKMSRGFSGVQRLFTDQKTPPFDGFLNCPKLCGQHKKNPWVENKKPQAEWRRSSGTTPVLTGCAYGLEINEIVYELVSLLERKRYVLGKRKNLIFIVDKPQGFW